MNRRSFIKLLSGLIYLPYIKKGKKMTTYADGIHVLEGDTITFASDAQGIGRAIITSADGRPPKIEVESGITIKNLWFGGTGEKDGTEHLHCKSGGLVENCVFWNFTDCLEEGTHYGSIYRGNKFINCGKGELSHAAYITAPTIDLPASLLESNIFISGEGYAMHYWHEPYNGIFKNNFLGDVKHGIVLGGYGLQAIKNILWSNSGSELANLPAWATFTFNDNFIGEDVDQSIYYHASANQEADGNIFYNHDGFGVDPGTNTVNTDEEEKYLGNLKANIDAAITAIENSFAESTATIHTDDTIADNFDLIQDVLDYFYREQVQEEKQAERMTHKIWIGNR